MFDDTIAGLAARTWDVAGREDGQGLTEYALILALVSMLSIGALTALSGGINGVFTTLTTAL